MQIAIVNDRADDRAELSESCRPGQFSACLYGHLYGEHGWNGGRQKAAPAKRSLSGSQ